MDMTIRSLPGVCPVLQAPGRHLRFSGTRTARPACGLSGINVLRKLEGQKRKPRMMSIYMSHIAYLPQKGRGKAAETVEIPTECAAQERDIESLRTTQRLIRGYDPTRYEASK